MGVYQPSENGSVEIDDQVLRQIIIEAASEIEGVYVISNIVFDKFLKFFFKSKYDGVSLNIKNDKDISAKICIGIKCGLNLPAVTKEIQDTVKEKVKETANVSLNRVDIHILNMDRGAV